MTKRRPLAVALSPAEPRTRPPRLAFGSFIADPETGRLIQGDRLIPLTPQPFETLYYLARCQGRVVTKTELMDELWRDTSVTDDVLVQCVVDIRRALGDTARSSQYVQTLPRRGYRFVAPVRVVGDEGARPIPPLALPGSDEGRRRAPARRRLLVPLAVLFAVLAAFAAWGVVQRTESGIGAAGTEAHAPAEPGPVPVSDSSWHPTGLATRPVDASRHYVEALDVWFRVGGRRGAEEAEAHLDQALRQDPSFAQAHVKKAEIQQWRRQVGYGNPDPRPAIMAAVRLVKELPAREQLLIESLEALIVHQRRDVAVTRLRSLLEVYPTFAQEAGVPSLLLETLMRQGRMEEMIRVGQAQLASPSIPAYQQAMVSSLLAEAYRHKGESGPAIENARRAVDLWPSRGTPEWLRQRGFLGRISLDGGRRDAAVAEFRAIAAAAAADVDNLTHAAWGLYMAGEREEAASHVERALKLDDSYGNAYHLLGWIQMAQGDHSRAAENLETAYEKTPPQYGRTYHGHLGGDLAALYYAGVAWQKAGLPARAKAALGRVVDHCRTLERYLGDEPGAAARWQAANFLGRARARLGRAVSEPPRLRDDDTTYFVQSARLDALRGRKDVALRKLAQGLALGFREYRHILDDADFESLREESEFRRLITEPLARLAASGPAPLSPP
jgi:DNA-binding winged helix-turn-helix (wHTH) protein/tetratricopeptide (TPR) repeat protein